MAEPRKPAQTARTPVRSRGRRSVAAPRPARRTQAERTATTRAQLVSATIDCLYETSYGATTLAEIARRAGVSLGALQHHFKTRNEIVLAALKHAISLYFQPYDVVAKADLSPAQRVSALVALLSKYFLSKEAVAVGTLWLATRGEEGLHDSVRDCYHEVSRGLRERWRNLFADCDYDRKRFVAAYSVFLHSLRGFQTHYLMRPEQSDVDQFLEGARAVLLDALELRPQQARAAKRT